MKLFYKIRFGYDIERELSIDDTELEKAIGVFLSDGKALFKSGAIKGNTIQSITPDYHRIMGWNNTHELDEFDHAELRQKGIDTKARDFQQLVEGRVRFLIKNKQQHLIEKNIDIPEQKNPAIKEISEATKQ